jgi:hypothetical protein
MKGIRGRESGKSREVVLIREDDAEVLERPQPPPELTAEERDEWHAICAAVPATYFAPATHMVVVSYCRHVVMARHLWQMLKHMERLPKKNFSLTDYRVLLGQHRASENAVAATLRTLRLTHLSAYATDRAPIPEAVPKPWLS